MMVPWNWKKKDGLFSGMCGAVRQQIDRDFKCSAALAALYFTPKCSKNTNFAKTDMNFAKI